MKRHLAGPAPGFPKCRRPPSVRVWNFALRPASRQRRGGANDRAMDQLALLRKRKATVPGRGAFARTELHGTTMSKDASRVSQVSLSPGQVRGDLVRGNRARM